MRMAALCRREHLHSGADWCGDSSIRKSVYFALFLALQKPEKLLLQSRNLATIDAHRYVYWHACFVVSRLVRGTTR